MVLVLLFLFIGIVIGVVLRKVKHLSVISERLIHVTIYLLLFTLGVKAGADRNVMNQLQYLGLTSFLISCFAIAGSVFLVWVVFTIFMKKKQDEK